ncbi:MAG TPA: hypothetical protein PLT00_04760 [Verrucomicrobiota bacterium]|nr:hypothetical protein [Verrucomicrobiota bacterium]HQB16008.1 hypothetical protein [Verrucomicrobiota bacterium]
MQTKPVKWLASRLCLLLPLIASSAAVHAQTSNPTLEASDKSNPFKTDVALRPPVVEEINGKVGYSGGGMNSAEGHNFDGSITFPLARQFGFQADALYSHIGSLDFYGGAGHLFWRNPDLGLIGVTGGYLVRSGVDTFQAGAEGEYYLNRFTFGFFAGVGAISCDRAAPFIDTTPTRFIGRVSADWYALEELRLGVSCTTAFRNNLVKGEAEYQTPIRGLAVTAEVAVGDHHYDHWLLGVRYYFGGNKSLRDRQRRDDPRGLMPQILHGLGVYGAEYNRKGRAYIAAHPGAGSWSGGSYVEVEREVGRDPIRFDTELPPMPPMPLMPPTE